jgi:hypothetical protein
VRAQKKEHLDFDTLTDNHFRRLQWWLISKQPDAGLLFPSDNARIDKTIVCAEYSVATQLSTLRINVDALKAPILDIGCGREHKLVNYFQ